MLTVTAVSIAFCSTAVLEIQWNGFAMRFLSISLIVAGLVLSTPGRAESVKILVQNSPLAGSQYYAVAKVWTEIRRGDRLTLTREPENLSLIHISRPDRTSHSSRRR